MILSFLSAYLSETVNSGTIGWSRRFIGEFYRYVHILILEFLDSLQLKHLFFFRVLLEHKIVQEQ